MRQVPCTISLECKPLAPKAGTKGGDAKVAPSDAPLALDVVPKKCVIPPHEHPCYFTPCKAMQTFFGTFEVQAEQGVERARHYAQLVTTT